MNTEIRYTACPSIACERGAITTMVGKIIGRASNGCEVRSETFMVPSNEMCPVCRGRGRITVEIDAAPDPSAPIAPMEAPMHVEITTEADGMLLVGGYRITAPAFTTAVQFDRALGRAFQDGIRVEPADGPGVWLTVNPATGATYTTSRRSCSCQAWQPCKHIPMACFVADVWNVQSARQAVAS